MPQLKVFPLHQSSGPEHQECVGNLQSFPYLTFFLLLSLEKFTCNWQSWTSPDSMALKKGLKQRIFVFVFIFLVFLLWVILLYPFCSLRRGDDLCQCTPTVEDLTLWSPCVSCFHFPPLLPAPALSPYQPWEAFLIWMTPLEHCIFLQ